MRASLSRPRSTAGDPARFLLQFRAPPASSRVTTVCTASCWVTLHQCSRCPAWTAPCRSFSYEPIVRVRCPVRSRATCSACILLAAEHSMRHRPAGSYGQAWCPAIAQRHRGSFKVPRGSTSPQRALSFTPACRGWTCMWVETASTRDTVRPPYRTIHSRWLRQQSLHLTCRLPWQSSLTKACPRHRSRPTCVRWFRPFRPALLSLKARVQTMLVMVHKPATRPASTD